MDFEGFYQEEVDRVLRTCWLVTLDDQAAADIAQEAMLRAWQRWDQLQDGDAGAWVRTVALNLGRSRWRRLKREARPARRPPVGAQASASTDPDLLAALRRLPHRQREALVLHYWGDFSVAACAAAMGVSEGSVKQHLRRARVGLGADPALQVVEELQS